MVHFKKLQKLNSPKSSCRAGEAFAASDLLKRKQNCSFQFFLRKLDFLS